MKRSLKRKRALPDLVCDTSPIQYLHQAGLLYILHELGHDIFIPPAVKQELAVGLDHGVDLPDLKQTEWIKMRRPQGIKSTKLLSDMGPGEAEVIEVTKSDWYRNIREQITPGDNMRFYREMHKLSQEKLGKKLGSFSRQNISNMERGHRSISKATAIKLAEFFDVSVDKFL